MDYDDIEVLTPRRRRALGALAVVALLLGAAAVAAHLVGRARLDELRREQARHGPLDPAAYAPPVAPEDENAARAFLAAAGEIEQDPADRAPLREARRKRPVEWSPAARAAIGRHLAANVAPLAALHRAAALPGGGLGLDYASPDPLGALSPWDVIETNRLLETQGEAAALDGDLEGAVAATEALGRLAVVLHVEPEPPLQVVALDAGGAALRVAREIVAGGLRNASPAAPPDLLPRLRRALAGTGDRAALARALRRQTALLLGGSSGRRARAIGRHAGGWWEPASWLAGEWLLAEGLAGWTELARVDELPYPRLAATIAAGRSRWPLGPFAADHVHLQGVAVRADATAASRQLAELALALAAAGARDGRYPPTLADLPPEHHAAAGPDPLTATRPTYRLAPDGSARLSLDAAEAKAGSENSLASPPFVWNLPSPR